MDEDIKSEGSITSTAATSGQILGFAAPLEHDPWVYRIVVLALSILSLGSLLSITILVLKGRTEMSGIIALGSVSVGALAGLLAPSVK